MSSNAAYMTAAVAAGLLGSAYCAYHIYHAYKRLLPVTWTHVGLLEEIYVYPIKSCGPIKVEKAECTFLGLKDSWLRDRILMVVDEKNNFITARVYPELLLVHPTVRQSILTLKHKGMEDMHVNLAEVIALQKPQTATVWGVPVLVLDCGAEASEWFTRLLHHPTHKFRLVYYAAQNARLLRGTTNKIYNFSKGDTGALPDETSFNLINEASVEELNTRLGTHPVTHRNFRPNFLLKGSKPYEEDDWKFVKIGDNVFEVLKPCTRCVLTTLDPETGIRDSKSEPLETLRGYRQIEDPEERRAAGNAPRMGIQMALRSGPGGIVSLHDKVYVA